MKSLHLIKPYFISHWPFIAVGLLSLILVDLLQLMIPRVIKKAVDAITTMQADAYNLLSYAAAVVLIAILMGLFRYIWRRCLLGAARYLEAALRNRLFAHIQTLSATYFDQVKTGDLMAHATNDINQVRMAAGMGLVAFNDAVVLGTAAIGFMLYINVKLTLYVLMPMPLIVLGTRLLSSRMHQRYQTVQASFSDLTEIVRERFAGMRMIKAHNGQIDSARVVNDASRAYVHENIKLVGITSLFFPLMVLLTNLSMAMVLLFGGRLAIVDEITPGDFVAFISYLNLLTWPMMALGWVTNLIQRGGASLERLDRIMQRTPDIQECSDPRRLPHIQGRITFEQVDFAYASNPPDVVLSDLNVHVDPGCIIGIVGPPGSGKSTLLQLVARIYDVTRGRVTIDGHDVRDLSLSDLRCQIAYVPQEPFLFAGTIRDNILFAHPQASEQQVRKVLAQAGLLETIAEFPAGMDTVVGEKGILLSGGQKQRIALARALLINARIVLLDDPISQVDTATGGGIVDTIRSMAGHKTVFVASHRLSAVRFADRILILENGRMLESGTHEQLLSGKGYYAKVYALQELENAV
jgi:ATP-binding cassette subfamily B protein